MAMAKFLITLNFVLKTTMHEHIQPFKMSKIRKISIIKNLNRFEGKCKKTLMFGYFWPVFVRQIFLFPQKKSLFTHRDNFNMQFRRKMIPGERERERERIRMRK